MLKREYLIRLRTDMHFTRENVAKELGVKDRYLKNIEDGRSLSTEAITRHFIVLSKLFGISITDLAAMEALYQVANIELIDTLSILLLVGSFDIVSISSILAMSTDFVLFSSKQ